MNEHENENEHTPPVLDTLIQNRPIQMLKAIVPYLYEPQQRMVSMMIRMIELQRTMQLFDAAPEMQAQELRICSNESPTERTHQILNVLREYCTPQERDQIDMILNILDLTSVTGIFNM
ncbi:hypothetical protein [Eubacterium ramulus]|jgi:hypothetical protein